MLLFKKIFGLIAGFSIILSIIKNPIKADEKRMAEIKVLQTHIRNYHETKGIYVAYRNADYSKKFYAENEIELIIHKAAKNTFDVLGVKKLPTLKDNFQAVRIVRVSHDSVDNIKVYDIMAVKLTMVKL